ncbi:unnamed protein product, partial [Meganyctiphanes norvegica]
MLGHRVPEGIHNEDQYFFQLFKMMQTETRGSLFYLFSLPAASSKPPTQTLKDYLQSPPLNMSNTLYKKKFNQSQRDTIDIDPSGKTFDISLLFVAIDVSCQGLSPQLKNLVTDNKNLRNKLLHEGQNINMTLINQTNYIQELQDLVENTYLAIGSSYAVDVSNEISQMKANITAVRNAQLPVPDIRKYHTDLKILLDELKKDLRVHGQEELKDISDSFIMTDPASFISGRDETFKVNAIFTRIDLVVEDTKGKKEDIPVNYENLLTVLGTNGKIPDILILEGPSGSGKTTLAKFMFSEWVKCKQGQPFSFIDLDNFDLVFPYECSNCNMSSYKDLLINIMPRVTSRLRDDDILKSVRELKILILVDAADDLNSESRKLLRELFETRVKESAGNLRVLCTTRPQAIQDLQPFLSKSLTKAHAKMTGISAKNRGEFATRLHDEMRREGQSTQQTSGLVDCLSHSQSHMGDHFKFPLNLTLFTYLWAADPTLVNGVTTTAVLYEAIHNLIMKRLFYRLSRHERVRDVKDSIEIENSCQKFLNVLNRECLVTIGCDAMIFPDKCTSILEKEADLLGLPRAEIFAAFLSSTREWTACGYKHKLEGPHKSLLEHYSANYIVDVMTGKIKTAQQLDLENQLASGGWNIFMKKRITRQLTESKSVYGILNENHNEIGTPLVMSKYQNLLVHLIGLMAYQGKEVLRQFYVEVIKLMKEAGLRGQTWFHVVSEAKCDSDVAKTVTENMTDEDKEIWYINGSSDIAASIEMMKTVFPKKITIKLETDPVKIDKLEGLLMKVNQENIEIRMKDQYSWRNCHESKINLPILNTSSSRCVVKGLYTSVTSITELPTSLEYLYLGIVKGPIVPALDNLKHHCPGLQ